MKSVLQDIFVLISIVLFSVIAQSSETVTIEQISVRAETGQIVAISQGRYDPGTFFFEAATGSRYGHIGILVRKADGSLLVYEAAPPVARVVPLDYYLNTSADKDGKFQVTISELATPLSENEKVNLVKYMDSELDKKIQYDFQHDFTDSEKMDCSEFVHRMFLSIGRQVGTVEALSELNLMSFGGQLMQMMQAMLGDQVPRPNQAILTPASIVRDLRVKNVLSSLELSYISDYELLKAWRATGALPALIANVYGLGSRKQANKMLEQVYPKLLAVASREPYKKTPPSCSKI